MVLLPVRPVASPRRLRSGRAGFTRSTLGPTPPHTAFAGLRAVGGQVRRRGRVWMPAQVGVTPPFWLKPFHPVVGGQPRRRGRVWLSPPVGPGPPPSPFARFASVVPIHRDGEDRARRRRGWLLHLIPSPLGGQTSGLGYNIYSNGGFGPINYSTPIATTTRLTWTSGPLLYPADWKFGVRAFDGYGEEQNLDCAVEIILDSGGNDITQRPAAPVGLRAFALAGGAIRAEWSYPFSTALALPTAFHVYLTPDTAGVLAPVTPVRSSRHGKRPAGGQVWRGSIGTSLGYQQPAATVLYGSMIANTFVCNIPGLMNGVTYLVGVRAFNAVAEEPNTVAVSVTADSVGPLPVDSLVGIAV